MEIKIYKEEDCTRITVEGLDKEIAKGIKEALCANDIDYSFVNNIRQISEFVKEIAEDINTKL